MNDNIAKLDTSETAHRAYQQAQVKDRCRLINTNLPTKTRTLKSKA
jgi:hypothetical protein